MSEFPVDTIIFYEEMVDIARQSSWEYHECYDDRRDDEIKLTIFWYRGGLYVLLLRESNENSYGTLWGSATAEAPELDLPTLGFNYVTHPI